MEAFFDCVGTVPKTVSRLTTAVDEFYKEIKKGNIPEPEKGPQDAKVFIDPEVRDTGAAYLCQQSHALVMMTRVATYSVGVVVGRWNEYTDHN